MELRGWDELDVILFSGDAYVDHPSFGAAVIGRILEAEGLKVAIIPQPNWRDDLRDFRKLGRPRLFFGISAEVWTRWLTNTLPTSVCAVRMIHPGRSSGYASGVSLHRIQSDSKKTLSGRSCYIRKYRSEFARLSHYDYWQDKVQKSILCDSGADLLIYGMGEKPIIELTRKMKELPFLRRMLH